MNARALLIITTIIELPAGITLLAVPSLAAELLLGDGLASPQALVVARVTGIALISLGTMCWLGRNTERRAQSGPAAGMLVYNLAVTLVLLHARFALSLEGIVLWPACVLHLGLAVWCGVCVQK